MILYINSCVRKESRTNRIAKALIEKLGDEYTELKLCEENLKPLNEATLEKRTNLIAEGDYTDPIFDYAKQFASADTIVISAPYWDFSFPALLKIYIENIYAIGVVSSYDENGNPAGLCRADRLYYITTAGGPYVPDFSFGYIKALAEQCFGINDVELISAEMLDVYGFDAEKIVADTIKNFDGDITGNSNG